MKRFLSAAAALLILPILGGARCSAQSMDDLNLQVHGYATQGFLYSTNNNWNTTDSTDGSAAWTEAVVNLTAQPQPRLRIGVQARYHLLGTYGNTIALDWAQADYKFNERFGFRVGKVKTPGGLLNETQDVDPGYLWVLLPQSIYPLASRNSILAHLGGTAYGALDLGRFFGKLEYRAFGGQRVIAVDDGFFQTIRDAGLTPGEFSGPTFGGMLTWDTPIPGLLLGGDASADKLSGSLSMGPFRGTTRIEGMHPSSLFTRYERSRVMLAGEYNRVPLRPTTEFGGQPTQVVWVDKRGFFVMASYRFAGKLIGGLYYSSMIDRAGSVGNARYQKDWALTTRYDFNPYLYLKVEQHFIDGTGISCSTSNNAAGLKPDSRMTQLKLGVSF